MSIREQIIFLVEVHCTPGHRAYRPFQLLRSSTTYTAMRQSTFLVPEREVASCQILRHVIARIHSAYLPLLLTNP